MSFDMEGMLNSTKEKVVDQATEKFGTGAKPIADEVAGKMEEAVASKLGVTLHGNTSTANDTASATNEADSATDDTDSASDDSDAATDDTNS